MESGQDKVSIPSGADSMTKLAIIELKVCLFIGVAVHLAVGYHLVY